jgi:hypothetical protein
MASNRNSNGKRDVRHLIWIGIVAATCIGGAWAMDRTDRVYAYGITGAMCDGLEGKIGALHKIIEVLHEDIRDIKSDVRDIRTKVDTHVLTDK